jgi:hypothetical protein
MVTPLAEIGWSSQLCRTMEALLNSIWQKLNKPLHYLLVGAALWAFAPKDYRWFGIIVGAFGLAGAIEWGGKQIGAWWQRHRAAEEMRGMVGRLNDDERDALIPHVEAGHQSFYLNWRDYHGFDATEERKDEYSRLAGVYQGLAMKGMLAIHTEDVMATFAITEPAWAALKKLTRRSG